jgi:hypothetical protein
MSSIVVCDRKEEDEDDNAEGLPDVINGGSNTLI